MAVTQNNYTGDGTTVLFSFTFPYLETTDIKVSLNGTVTTAYTLANATTVQFNAAPGNGVAVRIFRITSDESQKATFYPGSAIRSQDLNENFSQSLYKVQETTNYSVQDVGSVSLSANYTFSGTAAGQAPTLSNQFATKGYVDGVAFASGNLTVGDKGDITVNSATSWSIDNDAVTTAKILNAAVTEAKLSFTPIKSDVAQTFTAAQRGAISAIGNTSGTITLNFATANNFSLTLNNNASNTLDTPTNLTAGQSGVIYITQDGTGSRILSYHTNWDFAGGTVPTLSTTANAVDVLCYAVRTTGSIIATLIKDVKS